MAIDARTLGSDKREWVWAYREQIKLLDEFDAQGLYCAENEWDTSTWEAFLSTYGLLQGRHAQLRKQSKAVFEALVPIFRPAVASADKVQELTDRWHKGITELGKLVKERKDGTQSELRSMSAKLLWFYQPEEMTLFDDYAFTAIRQQPGLEKLEKPGYLFVFEKLFSDMAFEITEAARFSDRKYPYPRRVLDKWLWLNGNEEKPEFMKHFDRSLERALLTSS
jgi:hypothetical protein